MSHRQVTYKPIAPEDSTITSPGEKYRFTVLTEGLLRLEYSPDGKFEDRASTFAVHRDLPTPKFRAQKQDDGLHITTTKFHLTYTGGEFTLNSLSAQILGGITNWGSLWRYGEEVARGNLRGTARTLDEADGRIPLEPGVLARNGYALLDDSKSMLFDGDWVGSREKGKIDCYLFAHGLDFKAAMRDYYTVSGSTPLLPRWALGNWWSRYHAYSAEGYLELMDTFKEKGIPLSVAVIDMDWHLVQDKRVQDAGSSGWTGWVLLSLLISQLTSHRYTWNDKLFPDPAKFMDEIHQRKLRITLNDHPADGIFSFEDQYQAMAKTLNHDTSNNDPIAFDPTSKTFMDAFFDVLRRPNETQGLDFWWCDWQQGQNSRIPGIDPLWVLNHYSYHDNSLHHRPMHFSRFAGPGSHRYPIGFSGDTYTSWESLDFQPEFTNSASNIGFGWWSHDIGGHLYGKRNEELETRWVQYGVFSPIMRLHSTAGLWSSKEPWSYSIEHSTTQIAFMQLRHRFIPYLYSMNLRATKGIPLCTPMYWHDNHDQASYSVPNQYHFGSELIIAPITSPRDDETRKGSVKAWLPGGRFIDIFTETVYDGDRHLWLYRRIDEYPVLAKEGAIVPLDAGKLGNGCEEVESIELLVAVGKDGEFELYEDDGEKEDKMKSRITKITFTQSEGTLTISPTTEIEGLPHRRKWTIRLLACDLSKADCTVDGKPHDASLVKYHHGTKISIGSISINSKTTISIGKNPDFTIRDVRDQLQGSINDAQLELAQKQDIWDALDPKFGKSAQAARLTALPLSKKVLDSVLEIVLAQA
jgi:alpha-glucosidase (family GH31 glycosyl hydrolase)